METKNFKSELLQELEWRGFIAQITHTHELDNLLASQKITAYIGFDCTAESLHVGSLIQIMILRMLQKHGHRPLVLLGGGTTKIGDPSGKDEARKILNEEGIARNLNGIKNTLAKFVDFDANSSAAKAVLVNNNDWLQDLNYIDFLRDFGKHFSVNRMLTFDSVKLRLERNQPLSFLEFNYMILQAYDFYELNKNYGCRLQIGGSDQWGNIVNGVELTRRVAVDEVGKATKQVIEKIISDFPNEPKAKELLKSNSKIHESFDKHIENLDLLVQAKNDGQRILNDIHNPAFEMRVSSDFKALSKLIEESNEKVFGLTSPLLTTSDGKKMGKTADGAVWLDEKMLSAFDYFQYFRNTTDADTIKFIKLFTDLSREEIANLEKLQGQEINQAKEILAFETTKICHGEESAKAALQKAREIFVAKNSNAFEEKSLEIDLTQGKKLVEIIKEIGACESNGEARRLIEGKGVKIDGETVSDVNYLVRESGKFDLQVGKKKFYKVNIL